MNSFFKKTWKVFFVPGHKGNSEGFQSVQRLQKFSLCRGTKEIFKAFNQAKDLKNFLCAGAQRKFWRFSISPRTLKIFFVPRHKGNFQGFQSVQGLLKLSLCRGTKEILKVYNQSKDFKNSLCAAAQRKFSRFSISPRTIKILFVPRHKGNFQGFQSVQGLLKVSLLENSNDWKIIWS